MFGIYFFFNDTATTEIYTLSLHDALPIFLGRQSYRLADVEAQALRGHQGALLGHVLAQAAAQRLVQQVGRGVVRSEEHTSELQSRQYLVCRLLLEKKKKN